MPIMLGNYQEEYPDSPFLEIVQEADIHSAVVVPLKTREVMIGILYVYSPVPDKFREEDQQLLLALADQAAIAIENARLYQQVRQHAAELEAKVEARTQGKDDVAVQTLSGSVRIEVPKDVRPNARLRSMTGRPRCDCEEGDDIQIAVRSMSGKIEVVPF